MQDAVMQDVGLRANGIGCHGADGCQAHCRTQCGGHEKCGGHEWAPSDHDCSHEDHVDCICHGATLPNTVRCPDRAEEYSIVANAIAVSQFVALSDRQLPLLSSSHFSSSTSGREICILLGTQLL
jgi:hypothetical protein